MTRNVTAKAVDPRDRFVLYRLCDCTSCGGSGKDRFRFISGETFRCTECRGEGRIRQEIATCETPESLGVALVTLAREGEFSECPLGLLDRLPECTGCHGTGHLREGSPDGPRVVCTICQGSGVKPTGTWLILPWPSTARTLSAAGRELAKSRKKIRSSE